MAETKEARMGEMVDHVAEALWQAESIRCRGEPRRVSWHDVGDEREKWQTMARAAIDAMRQPTQDMRHACWDLLEKNAAVGNLKPGGIRGSGFPDVLLDRMISAALSQDPPHVV